MSDLFRLRSSLQPNELFRFNDGDQQFTIHVTDDDVRFMVDMTTLTVVVEGVQGELLQRWQTVVDYELGKVLDGERERVG